jgi:transposase-like protein
VGDAVPAGGAVAEEGGLDLLTLWRFPPPIWKSLRTTNVLENLN